MVKIVSLSYIFRSPIKSKYLLQYVAMKKKKAERRIKMLLGVQG